MTRKIRYCWGPLDGIEALLPPAVNSVYLVSAGDGRYEGSMVFLEPPRSECVWYARSILRQDKFDFVGYLKAKGT